MPYLIRTQQSLKGVHICVALFLCNECAKLIIQSGIKEVLFVSDKYHDNEEMIASRRLLDMAGAQYRYDSIYFIL